MTPAEIVHSVLDPQIERLFRKMDKLEDDHGPWSTMPLKYFQQHGHLGRTAAHLGIARDRVIRALEKENPEDNPMCGRCQKVHASGMYRTHLMDSSSPAEYRSLCSNCALDMGRAGYVLEAVTPRP